MGFLLCIFPNNILIEKCIFYSAKALPFVTRGRYGHIQGPREDDPYNLTDIFSVSNISFSEDAR